MSAAISTSVCKLNTLCIKGKGRSHEECLYFYMIVFNIEIHDNQYNVNRKQFVIPLVSIHLCTLTHMAAMHNVPGGTM